MILMRTLRKDYARYSKDEELDDMVCSTEMLCSTEIRYIRQKYGMLDRNMVSVWNKKPTRCHLVLYLFLLYKLLNVFRATLCPSSGADDLVVFLPRVM